MDFYLFKSVFEFQNATLVDWLTWLILTLTLFVLCFYTYYTKKLQNSAKTQTVETINQTKELIRQRKLSILPSLLHSIENENGNFHFFINNVGNGPAINISFRIENYPNSSYNIQQKNVTPVLLKGDKKKAVLITENKKIEIENHALLPLKEGIPNSPAIKINFYFQDLEGRPHYQVNDMGNEYIHGKVETKGLG
jgi:hypothetical protein